MSIQETRRLFGRKYRAHHDTNARHRALLRKTLELVTEEQVVKDLTRVNQLRTVMGTEGNMHRLGTIIASREVNGRRQNREGPTPNGQARVHLEAYLDAYDQCFKKQGMEYRVRREAGVAILQDAEQAWHNWVVGYLGRARPAWALEPLPGLDRVRVAVPPSRGTKRRAAHLFNGHIVYIVLYKAVSWIVRPALHEDDGREQGGKRSREQWDLQRATADNIDKRLVNMIGKVRFETLLNPPYRIAAPQMSMHSADSSDGPRHISAADLYTDQYRPSTPPPLSSSPSPPPRKRQRVARVRSSDDAIPRRVLKLLDIEAAEDDVQDEDDDDDEMGEFIDDEPNHELAAPAFALPFAHKTPAAADEDAETLRKIAARFEDLAREDREEPMMAGEDDAPAIPYFPPLSAPALNGFLVAPHWELRLMDFMMMELDDIAMVGTQGPSSRLVFYETVPDADPGEEAPDSQTSEAADIPPANAARVANAAKAWLTAHRVSFRGPEPISPAECGLLLGLRHDNNPNAVLTDQRYNCFARLKSQIFRGIYYNDLVFIGPVNNPVIYIVPRLDLSPNGLPRGQRATRGLVHTEALKLHLGGGDELEFTRRGSRCFWGKRTFAPLWGLEVLPPDLRYSVVGVHPTDDELELFWASKCLEICAAFTGVSCAVQEGDRVVATDPVLNVKEDGEVAAFFERREGNQRLRMAVVVAVAPPGRQGAVDKNSGRLRVKSVGGIQISGLASGLVSVHHVSELRVHILNPRRAINVGDRVVVVSGSAYRGQSGRIIDFTTPSSIRVDSPELGVLEVMLRHVQLDLRRGDIVRIVRGEHKDQVGLILGLYLAGGMELYLCDPKRLKTHVEPGTGQMKLSVEAETQHAEEMDAMEVLVIRVQTRDVVLVHLDGSGGHQSVECRRQADSVLDRAREDWERDLMHTGRFLTGMFVRVVGKHAKKGQFGVITDYHRTKPAPEGRDSLSRIREWGDIRRDVRIHVAVEHSLIVDEMEVDNVVERFCGLHVMMAVLLKGYRNLNVFEPRVSPRNPTPPPPPLENVDLTEAEIVYLEEAERRRQAPEAPALDAWSPPDIGETTGRWLAHPKMVWKRIDVQVCSAETILELRKMPNVGNRAGVKVLKVAGLEGYLRPFGHAVTEDKAYAAVLEFLGPGRDARVPIVALRPLRQTPINGGRGEMRCISARKCRVIIIGPDVEGNRDRIGEYAETMPESSAPCPSGHKIVLVRFAWERRSDGSDYSPQAQYHLECLCSALNRDTPSQPPVPRTDFDRKCS
ncbi:hypothetical protein B0H12DRAFT_1074831 [Mycena haematopus]|nr:hypothetical protein B0H12DRAFT_1074831 [Mycena haematopus]